MRSIQAAVAALAASVAFVCSASAIAQSQPASQRKVFGYQDASGTFHPFHRAIPDAATATPTTGTYDITINIVVKSPLPAKTVVGCSVNVEESNTDTRTYTSDVDYTNLASVTATPTATGYTCNFKLHYSWLIPASTTQNPVTSAVSGGFYVTAASSTTTGEMTSSAEGGLAIAITVPATGSVTTTTIETSI